MNQDSDFRGAPVKVGDELDVKIEAVGEKGDGLTRIKGFILFVSGVKEGDEVRVKVTRVLKKVGFAEVISSEQAEEVVQEEQKVQDELEEDSEITEDSEDF